MKIQSKILLSIAASVAVAAVVALIAFSILRGMNAELARIRVYDRIIGKTHALNILAAYLKAGSDQSDIRQVRSTLRSLDDLLDKMTSQTPREEALVRELQRNDGELGPIIDQMFFAKQGIDDGIERERRNVLASQLWMKVRFISEDTDRLKDISDSRIISAQGKAGATLIILIVLLAVTNGIIYFLSGRSIVRGQEALRESEARFRVTLGSIGDAVIATDASGLITFLNPVAAELTGWEPGAAAHQPIQKVFRIINEQTRESARNVVERVLREGNTVNLANHTALITRDGREIPIEDSAAPIKDSSGSIAGVVLVFHDVTEKRQVQKAIQESEARFRRLVTLAPIPLCFVNKEGELVYFNDRFTQLFGYTKDDVPTLEEWWQLAYPQEQYRRWVLDTWGAAVRKAAEEKTDIEPVEYRVTCKNGDVRLVEIWGIAMEDNILATFIDVTERKRVEGELRESRSRLDLALQSAHMGVWYWDIIEDRRWFDDQVCHLLGINPAEFTGTAEEFFNAAHPGDRSAIREALARGIEQDGLYEAEYRAVWPDSSVHHIIARGKLVCDDNGRPVRLNGIIWDITGRKRAEEALRESEDRFRTLANGIPQLAWIADADGYIFWYNQRWYEYTGTTPEQMEGWGWQSVHSPETLPGVLERWKGSIATGNPFDMVFPLRGADGIFRDFLTRVMPVNDANGNVIRWCGTNTDITERKQMEEELRNSRNELDLRVLERTADLEKVNHELLIEIQERRRAEEAVRASEREFRLLAEAMPQIVWITRPDGWNIYFNQRWLDYTGQTLEESYGHGWNKPFHPDDQQGAWDAWQNATKNGAVYDLECRLRRVDGVYRWWLIRGVPVLDERGTILKWFGTCTDIDELKRMEEALHKSLNELEFNVQERTATIAKLELVNAELREFAYVASHDLQEPLRAVSSYVQLLSQRYKGRLDQDADDFIFYAQDGASRMQKLIEDLLAYSRVGTRESPFEPIDCEAVLKETLLNLQLAIEDSGARVSTDPLPTVLADRFQLVQLFQNLLSNAIKFRGESAPVIHIGVEKRNGAWLFSVRDNGLGMEEQYFQRIFQVFQRLHGRDEYPGTGIGLAICKKIVEKHGGKIWVESAPGAGATFYFTIPVIRG